MCTHQAIGVTCDMSSLLHPQLDQAKQERTILSTRRALFGEDRWSAKNTVPRDTLTKAEAFAGNKYRNACLTSPIDYRLVTSAERGRSDLSDLGTAQPRAKKTK